MKSSIECSTEEGRPSVGRIYGQQQQLLLLLPCLVFFLLLLLLSLSLLSARLVAAGWALSRFNFCWKTSKRRKRKWEPLALEHDLLCISNDLVCLTCCCSCHPPPPRFLLLLLLLLLPRQLLPPLSSSHKIMTIICLCYIPDGQFSNRADDAVCRARVG